jgi:peptidoglycan/xylan/chitin deacetylase (PgdA/CDA1 family)/lysophospholipase L1-like esterase
MKFLLLLLLFSYGLTAQVILPIKSVSTTKKIVALTFDDGPIPGITEQFLKLFNEENIKATFFNLGNNIEANTSLAKVVLEKGHEIGNHSYTHPKLPEFYDSTKIFSEINDFQKLVKTKLNYIPKLFRAPYLQYDERVTNILSELKLKLVSAKVFCKDAKPNVDPNIIIKKVLDNVSPGAIILGHEREHTVKALKIIIPELKNRGYKFVTVSELLKINGDWKKINPNNKNIHISGSKFSKVNDNEIIFQRHTDSLLALTISESKFNSTKAKTTTGIVISFKTESPDIKAHFRKLTGEQRNGTFGIFQNGVLVSTQTLDTRDDSSVVINIKSQNPNKKTFFEITLPTWNNISFTGLEIDANYNLAKHQSEQKKVYVAYGNSITHGTGQKGTHETYTFKVAKYFGWELYNVAVGGAKTSVAIAKMLRNNFERIDCLTILIGYNDYNGEGVDTLEYQKRYESVIRNIRAKHKTTPIFCITQTYTTQLNSKISGISISDFRKVVTNLVKKIKKEGDENIFIINGEDITSESNLKAAVHVTVNGATFFADSLIKEIESRIDAVSTDIDNPNDKYGNKNNVDSQLKYSLYPNPSKEILNIESKEEIKKINIYNLLGQTVKTVSKNFNNLHINNLPQGVYFVLIKNNIGEYFTKKILVAR